MHKHPDLTRRRIDQFVNGRLEPLLYPRTAPVDSLEAWHIGGQPVPFTQAAKAPYEPFALGEKWGPAWDTTWFRVRVSVPEDWEGQPAQLLFAFGDRAGGEGFSVEGLAWVDGKPLCAVNLHRQEIALTEAAKAGESFEVHIEAAANGHDAGKRFGEPYWSEPVGPPRFSVERVELAMADPEGWRLYHDIRALYSAMYALPEDGPRRGQILRALNELCKVLVPGERASWEPAARLVRPLLERRNGDTVHTISCVGHAHIDTAWLWPLRETIRKCARTFSSALRYMEQYPEYVFGCSQPVQYSWMKKHYPDIWEGIKAACRRGQWAPMGAMWIEPDCNVPSGESLARQLLHGKLFFEEELGVEIRDVWIPDVFGYSASMPQLMQKAGVDSFLTQKISWNEFNRFPHHTFLWEGIDGTRMFTHFPPADTYNGNFEARQLANSVRRFKENDRATRSLYPYGYGDGGGGPTRGMLEFARRFADFDGLPRVELEGPAAFFEKAKEDAVDPPVWVGELYLELHRATYTTQGRTKRGNRKSEILMRECEFADALDHILSPADQRDGPVLEQPERAVYDTWDYAWPRKRRGHAAALDRAWKLILLNQFHDIIPGSSIAWVYRDSDIDYGTVALLGEAVREDSLAHLRARFPTEGLEEPLLALNATDQARGEVAALPGGGLGWVEVPAFGHAVFDACAARQLPEGVRPARIETLDTGGFLLDNGRVRARVGPDGYLESLYDTENEREALAEGARGGELRLYDDRPYNWEAWDFALYALEKHEVLALSEMRVVEEGPMRVAVETLRRFGNSVLTQRIELRAGLRRVDFVTEADWHERKRLLRACFPVNVLSARATYEIPFGTVERPTHFNTSWDMARFETAGQRWADLSEGDYGVALLTDCKYGYAAIGNELGLSLLRGPEHPDPFADEGPHAFTYSLFPHAGDHRTGGVTEEAARLNQPAHLRALEPGNAGELPAEAAWFGVDRPGLYLDSVKLAEREEALIVRLYEGWGTRGAAELTTALPLKQARVANVMERDGETLELKDGTLRFEVKPYEIITFKFSF